MASPDVLIIHFTPPSVIGGVEHIIHQHAELLRNAGCRVQIVAGRPGDVSAGVDVIPEIDAARPENAHIENHLAQGIVGPAFYRARDRVYEQLAPLIAQSDVTIAHNAMTLHFSLPLTAALWQAAEQGFTGELIAWCHDLSWTNPLYLPSMHDGYPWNLLRSPAPATRYVTVSESRRRELSQLWGGGRSDIAVIPNGIDVQGFLNLGREAREIAKQYQLFDRDMVLLLPVRITRRKNIELAIRAVRALVESGIDVRLLVSGPPGPHHPSRSHTYLDELLQLRRELKVEDQVVFLVHDLGHDLSDRAVADLYRLTDVLLFPSTQEGFGLPLLEAGIARVPAVVSDIPIFEEVGGDDVIRFDLEESADTIAQSICRAVDTGPAHLYRRVLRDFRWDAVMERMIMPLLSKAASAPRRKAESDTSR